MLEEQRKQLETGVMGQIQRLDGKVTDLQQINEEKSTERQWEMANQISGLQNQLEAGLTGFRGQIDGKLADLQQKLQQQLTGVQEQLERKVTEQHKEAEKQISGMQTRLQEDVLLATLLQPGGMQALLQRFKQIPSSLLSVTGFRPPFEFTLTKFSVYKTKGWSGEWYSDPFYSNPGGYKFQLNIDTNGIPQGTRISAWLRAQKGEHNNKPIQVIAHLQLLNQRGDHGHVVASLNTNVNKGEIVYKEISRKFIAHSELRYNVAKDTQYLKDDCLLFRLYLKVTPQI